MLFNIHVEPSFWWPEMPCHSNPIQTRVKYVPREQSSWGPHGAHLGRPQMGPYWPYEPCYRGIHASEVATGWRKNIVRSFATRSVIPLDAHSMVWSLGTSFRETFLVSLCCLYRFVNEITMWQKANIQFNIQINATLYYLIERKVHQFLSQLHSAPSFMKLNENKFVI